MKRTFTSLVLGIALLVGGGGVGLAQDAGIEAANRGDYATAFRVWSALASKGDAYAQVNLGIMYDKGQGVAQDYREAAHWYRLSAEQGVADAQLNLGMLYAHGQGVTQNYSSARIWLVKSAEQGNASAQNNLGVMFNNGYGVTQDYIIAHMWFNISASTGNESAVKNRDLVAGEMTAAQIARAQELARQCVAKNYKGC